MFVKLLNDKIIAVNAYYDKIKLEKIKFMNKLICEIKTLNTRNKH